MFTLTIDLVTTLALAGLFLFIGRALQQRISFLDKFSVPVPIIGGLLFASIVFILRERNLLNVTLDTSLRPLLQTVFFTTIGMSATLALLRRGGWRIGFFWLIASVTAVVQNIVGIGTAYALGAPPALGLICGALTLSGGPATGLAFAPNFERLGIADASTLILAAATFGICAATLVGNPTATWLIRRSQLATPRSETALNTNTFDNTAATSISQQPLHACAVDSVNIGNGVADAADVAVAPLSARTVLHELQIVLVVIGIGALVGWALAKANITLPGYIGAMIVAAVMRNLDDKFGWFKINPTAIEAISAVALGLFLVIATMDLKLWQLAGLAVPMLIILVLQTLVMILYAVLVTFTLMGKTYEAAITASGHIGFGLGITPNAVANMNALVERYGAAPNSFLIVPIVGAFFIDFSNALVITLFLNVLQ